MRAARLELAVAAALAATLVVLGTAFGAAKKPDDPRASTFVDGRAGLHALHLLLEGVGAKPTRLQRAPSAADPTDRTLVVARPSEPITRRETKELIDWVVAGGRLVIVGGSSPFGAMAPYEEPLLEAFGLEDRAGQPTGLTPKVSDAALGDDLGTIEWTSGWAVARRVSTTETPPKTDPFERLVTAGEGCLVGRLPWGDGVGEVVVLADAGLLDNERLGRGDNAVLAARILLGREAVEFDEFHHGFRQGGGADHVVGALAALLVDSWPGRAVLVVVFAGALFLAGAAVRFGAPERERVRPRRKLSEHADALGSLFEAAGARSEALHVLAAGARRAIGTRSGIPAGLPAVEFARRLAESPGGGARELAAAIARADAARATKDVEMAEVAATLAAARRRYLHGG